MNEHAPLAQLAVSLLIRGEQEKYLLDTGGLAILENAVVALLSTGLPERQTLIDLAAIAFTLEEQLESPSAAKAIVRMLANVPGIGRLLPELVVNDGRSAKEWLALQGGPGKTRELPDGPKMLLSSLFSAPRRC